MNWFYIGAFNAFAGGFCLATGLVVGGWFYLVLGLINLALVYNCSRYLKEYHNL